MFPCTPARRNFRWSTCTCRGTGGPSVTLKPFKCGVLNTWLKMYRMARSLETSHVIRFIVRIGFLIIPQYGLYFSLPPTEPKLPASQRNSHLSPKSL